MHRAFRSGVSYNIEVRVFKEPTTGHKQIHSLTSIVISVLDVPHLSLFKVRKQFNVMSWIINDKIFLQKLNYVANFINNGINQYYFNIKRDILLQFLLGMSLQLMLLDLNYFNFLDSQTFNIGISAKNKVQKIGYAGSERGNNEG